MPNYRKLSPAEIDQARQKGYTVDDQTVIDPDTGDIGKLEPGETPKTSDVSPDGKEQPGVGMETARKPTIDEQIDAIPVLGMVKRQTTRSALPAAVGGALIAGTAPFIGPFSVIPGAIAGGATRLGQDYLLRRYSAAHPSSATARTEALAQRDIAEHPYGSLLASLPASGFVPGGRFIPWKPAGLKPSLGMVGIQGGIDVATQVPGVLQGQSYDPVRTLLSSATSPFMVKPGTAAGRAAAPTPAGEKSYEAEFNRLKGVGAAEDVKAKMGLSKVAAANEAANVAAVQQAKQAGSEISQEGAVPQATVKSAAQSAEALVTGKAKAIEEADKLMSEYTAGKKRVIKMAELINDIPDGDPRKTEAVQRLANYRKEVDALHAAALAKFPIGPETVPTAVGTAELAKPGEMVKIPEPKKEQLGAVAPIPTEQPEGAAAIKGLGTATPAVETKAKPPVAKTPLTFEELQTKPIPSVERAEVVPPNVTPEAQLEAMAKGKGISEPTQISNKPSLTPEEAAANETARQRIQFLKQNFSPQELQELIRKRQITAPNKGMGKEAGSVLNPFQGKVGEKLEQARDFVENLYKVWKDRPRPEPNREPGYDPIAHFNQWVGGPTMRLLSRGGVAQEFAEAYKPMANMYRKLAYGWTLDTKNAAKGTTVSDRYAANDYLQARNDNRPLPSLSPKQQRLVDGLLETLYKITLKVSEPNMPMVKAYRPDGTSYERPREIRKGWWPGEHIESNEASLILNNPTKYRTEWDQLRNDYINYWVKEKGQTQAIAEKHFNNTKSVSVTANRDPHAEYASLRYEEGLGIPPEYRERDPVLAMQKYLTRVAQDIPYHKFIELNPAIARALGMGSNGQGEAIPASVTMKSGEIVNTSPLASDPNVVSILRDFVGATQPGQGQQEGWTHLFNTMVAGVKSQTLDILASIGPMNEFLQPGEAKYIIKGLADIFNPSARETAFRGGSVRPLRNITPSAALELNNAAAKIADLWSIGTGAEQTSQGARIMFDSIARSALRNRLAHGDASLIEKLGPKNWRELSYQEVEDFIASEFAMNVGVNSVGL